MNKDSNSNSKKAVENIIKEKKNARDKKIKENEALIHSVKQSFKDLDVGIKSIQVGNLQINISNESNENNSVELPRPKERGFLFHWKQP